jgi:hypothetical protein
VFRIRSLLLLFSLSLKLQAITTENLSEINKFPEINSHFDSTKSISIITPNGGENWQIDNWFAIFWQQSNVEFLDLAYSTNGGQNWIKIADSVNANDGAYTWGPIPNVPSVNCLIKAVDCSDSNIYDVSDNVFTIFLNPQITLTEPNGGETIGNQFDIKWFSQNVYHVNILLSLDNGLNWTMIASNIENSEIYACTVPDTTSDNCLIKVENVDDNTIFDISDQTFRIVPFHKFSYFPLSVGNKWYFSWSGNLIRTVLEVTSDTLMPDMKTYAKIDRIEKLNGEWTRFSGYYYLREEGNIVYNYPNDTLLNYDWNNSTTFEELNYTFTEVQVKYQNVFSVDRLTYLLYIYKPYEFVSYTDSIGFNALYALGWRDWTEASRYLIGCNIDNKTYGEVLTEITEVDVQKPLAFQLSQNFPNPFNPTTTILFSIPTTPAPLPLLTKEGIEGWLVTLKVYDILGREVATLVNEEKPAGNYEVTFNGQDLPSEIYFYKLQAGDYTDIKKLILLR